MFDLYSLPESRSQNLNLVWKNNKRIYVYFFDNLSQTGGFFLGSNPEKNLLISIFRETAGFQHYGATTLFVGS